MGLVLEYLAGQTPLTEEELEGLLVKTISTKGELDELEQLNIQQATEWTLRRKFNKETILTEEFIHELHKRMYSDVWRWAGSTRKSDKSIGVSWFDIPVALRTLMDNCKYWIDNKVFDDEEVAIRFEHEIVRVHCYPNGNGRHSRLIADVIISHIFKGKVFSWGGGGSLTKEGEARVEYLKAIKIADKGEIKPLIHFARL
jgi:Fic-DOC domain mobile mystery protein B